MGLRRSALAIVVMSMLFGLAGPAQANQAPTPSSDAPPRTHDPRCGPFCVVLAVRAVPVVIAAARTLKASKAVSRLRKVGRAAKATPQTGVRITLARAKAVREQSKLISRRGKAWVKKHWASRPLYVRACFWGIVGFETEEILRDGVMTLKEWQDYMDKMRFGTLSVGWLDDNYRNLYYLPGFDFRKRLDSWTYACAAGMVIKGAFNQ